MTPRQITKKTPSAIAKRIKEHNQTIKKNQAINNYKNQKILEGYTPINNNTLTRTTTTGKNKSVETITINNDGTINIKTTNYEQRIPEQRKSNTQEIRKLQKLLKRIRSGQSKVSSEQALNNLKNRIAALRRGQSGYVWSSGKTTTTNEEIPSWQSLGEQYLQETVGQRSDLLTNAPYQQFIKNQIRWYNDKSSVQRPQLPYKSLYNTSMDIFANRHSSIPARDTIRVINTVEPAKKIPWYGKLDVLADKSEQKGGILLPAVYGAGQGVIDFGKNTYELGKNVGYELPKYFITTNSENYVTDIQNWFSTLPKNLQETFLRAGESLRVRPSYSGGWIIGQIAATKGVSEAIPVVTRTGRNAIIRISREQIPSTAYIPEGVEGLTTSSSVDDVMQKFLKTKEGRKLQATHATQSKGIEQSKTVRTGQRQRVKGKPAKPEDEGLYVTPKDLTQPHFLGVADATEYSFSLNPFKTPTPRIVEISFDKIKYFPKTILRKARIEGNLYDWNAINKYLSSQTGKGTIHITARRTLEHTSEPEAIISVGEKFVKLPSNKYIMYKGHAVPITKLKLLKEAEEFFYKNKAIDYNKVPKSSYDITRYKTPPYYSTYGLANENNYYYQKGKKYTYPTYYNSNYEQNYKKYDIRAGKYTYPNKKGKNYYNLSNYATPYYRNYRKGSANTTTTYETVPPTTPKEENDKKKRRINTIKSKDLSGWYAEVFNRLGKLLQTETYETYHDALRAGMTLSEQTGLPNIQIKKRSTTIIKRFQQPTKPYHFKPSADSYKRKIYKKETPKWNNNNLFNIIKGKAISY